jgi:hypothetical protein
VIADSYVAARITAVDDLVGHLQRCAATGWAPGITDIADALLAEDVDSAEFHKILAVSVAVMAQRLALGAEGRA